MAERDKDIDAAFALQSQLRGPWRAYLDALAPLRPELHRYCVRLTGNLWDGEDLAQDALVKVFSLLGKIDADLEQPRAYLLRTATTLWIDRSRRAARQRAWEAAQRSMADTMAHAPDPASRVEQGQAVREAAGALLQRLAPKERAAVLLKDMFDLSLDETAALLHTSVGAVKAALHRGRERLADPERDAPRAAPKVSAQLVDRFVDAMSRADVQALRALCLDEVCVELVGGAEMEGFERSKGFFEHAHMSFPALGFGDNPNWRTAEYLGEPLVLGFRTLEGQEGLNEVHRFDLEQDKIARIRCYCFCPDTLRVLGEHMGLPVLRRPYRSPSPDEVQAVLRELTPGPT